MAILSRLSDLWSGRLPLSAAFWNYAIFWGFLVNIGAMFAALALLVAYDGAPTGRTWPAILAAALHLAPMPYNVLVLVGVWRSAGRPENSAEAKLASRLAIAAWTAVMTIV